MLVSYLLILGVIYIFLHSPCEYKKDEGVCDCGEIDYEFPTSAKVVTVALSILSACMWTYFILKTK